MEPNTNILTRDWYDKLQESAATTFINLPIEFQLKGYDYNFISKSYYNFFNSDSNTRQDKLQLAKKFLKFIKSINKNRARFELGEEFFKTFEYFMNNFPDLMAKQDLIHLETLDILTEAIDKSQFLEDVLNVEELQLRIKKLEAVREQEDIIEAEFEEENGFIEEYKLLNETF